MIEALIGGERDPHVLAQLAKGTLRRKIPDLTMALAGASSNTTPCWPACISTTSTIST